MSELNWAVGITTAPRKPPMLESTVASLAEAGWMLPTVFADASVFVSTRLPIWTVKRHPPPAGSYQNFLFALRQLILMRPLADFYLIAQDDCQFTAGLRRHFDLHPPPADGVLSLFTVAANHRPEFPGWNRCQNVPHDAMGAQAYILPREIALRMDRKPHTPQASYQTDTRVGRWCKANCVPYYCHTPSLVRHLAVAENESSLPQVGGTELNRQCAEFLERIPDDNSFPPIAGRMAGVVE